MIRHLLNKSRHVLIDVCAIRYGLGDRRPRARPALGPLDPLTKTFVIRIEEEQKIFRICLVARLIFLQNSFKEPGGVPDVPARRAHELGGLHDIVFDLEWGDDFESAGADGLVELCQLRLLRNYCLRPCRNHCLRYSTSSESMFQTEDQLPSPPRSDLDSTM